ncbi:MAG: 2-oxoacid:acceptor oxidoreductase family protein [Negativicutes bacterium]
MTHEIVMAGFGGQGVLLVGQLLAYAGMLEEKQVSWMPSYGPEMRGGTANCSVIISEEPIGAPIIAEPTAVVAMNLPSMDKFAPSIKTGGVLIINSSLISTEPKRKDLVVYKVPANEIAIEIGNPKVANMVILGAVIAATNAVTVDWAIKAFQKKFASKPKMFTVNEQAIRRGMECVINAGK